MLTRYVSKHTHTHCIVPSSWLYKHIEAPERLSLNQTSGAVCSVISKLG